MQVLTLDEGAFEAHAAMLAAEVARRLPPGGYGAVVGVRRGGSIVCDAFLRHFPAGAVGFRTDVALQRPSTKRKTAGVGRLLRLLPRPLLDLMRMAEAKLLERRHRDGVPLPPVPVPLSEGLRCLLEEEHVPEVLVIDDAIDSGDTLFSVINSLKEVNPAARVRVAVVTVTTDHPRVEADFSIYHNKTLVRFPWSSDYRK